MADEDEVVSANNNEEVFVYMGGNMVVPDDVVRAQVHPSVTVIPDSTVCTVYSAFQGRQNLDVIDLCDGLIVIGNDAFIYCYSLRHVNIPHPLSKQLVALLLVGHH